ncbi:MAG: tRNA uridine-5-carboxymethylaminomethyl(34) synthesis enzyme MnmG [Bacteroidales bacterium]|nr:tRNA uridine-5-carboxymethylaminomethyl(34) synthesis enzyme MnmG [Bacteroidales bacterium]MCF8403483.1 tRNA uridine-5-carboxymethylaminomethyl(34) synthesis enzyme MnmG [Bacteroidales bacterium]
MFKTYDVIVVGGGHAGCEASAAAANMSSATLLITMNMANIAQMSCNPAMGGIAKGQMVREIDALGGYSGIVTDRTMIQFRMLNKSKGPAMWSPRAQSDRMLFSMEWRKILEGIPNLDFWQDVVIGLLVKDKRIIGVKTQMGHEILSKSVILTNGTFLNGVIHIGRKQFGGGRIAEKAVTGLTENLKKLGFESDRMKTGTPVRVDGRTIDFSKLAVQPGDENPGKFSFTDTPGLTDQRNCYMAYTSQKVHDILKKGFNDSPMFNGRIEGIGPRYCPSIEDKIDRFTDKNYHQLFVEPEGRDSIEYYINGFSSSLPDYIQYEALQNIEGFENAKIFRPGYAIEYDFFYPVQLKNTLETRRIERLYFAGQINGTTGYEEAAAQGIIAGINAHLKINDKESFVLSRSEAYIGVLVDDLVNKGVDEPYRMFTSRAEYRILLRQNNADIRLTERSGNIGLAGNDRFEIVKKKLESIEKLIKFLNMESISPKDAFNILEKTNTSPLSQKTRLVNLILRPQVSIEDISIEYEPLYRFIQTFDKSIISDVLQEAEIRIKYGGYIEKEQEVAVKLGKLDQFKLKPDLDYFALKSLSYEAREKLTKLRPDTIGQASRIAGISPSDISVLTVYLGK